MFSELLQLADIVQERVSQFSVPFVLQITAFRVRAIPR